MNEMMNFEFGSQQLRTLGTPEEPLFVAADVAEILGYENSRTMTRRLDDDEKGVQKLHTLGGEQEMTVINESGLYSAILGSNKPEAKPFKKWVTSEVLPTIRKTGGYMIAAPEETPEQLALRAMQVLQATVERQKLQLNAANQAIGELTPDAEYCRDVLASESLRTVDSIAVDLGLRRANDLNKILESWHWQWRRGQEWIPTSEPREKGYCKTVTVRYGTEDYPKSKTYLKWTETGRRAIIERYKRECA